MYKYSHQFVWDNTFGKTARANHFVYKSHIEHLHFLEFSIITTFFFYLSHRLERKYALFNCFLELIFNLYFKLCLANLFIQLYLLLQPQNEEYFF